LYYFAAPLLVRYRNSFAIPTAAALSWVLFFRWPHIRDVYIAEPSYFISAAALLWAWLAGWLAYAYSENRYTLAAFSAAGFLGIWSQATFFGIVDFKSAAANVLAWFFTLVVVFFRVGIPISHKLKAVANYLGEISFPLYLLQYPVLFALTSSVLKAHPNWNYGAVQVVIALICASLAYHLVDRPLRFESKYAPRALDTAIKPTPAG
jgi:peptidoglycan/LPS O-acetylase OafA/YrhL